MNYIDATNYINNIVNNYLVIGLTYNADDCYQMRSGATVTYEGPTYPNEYDTKQTFNYKINKYSRRSTLYRYDYFHFGVYIRYYFYNDNNVRLTDSEICSTYVKYINDLLKLTQLPKDLSDIVKSYLIQK